MFVGVLMLLLVNAFPDAIAIGSLEPGPEWRGLRTWCLWVRDLAVDVQENSAPPCRDLVGLSRDWPGL